MTEAPKVHVFERAGLGKAPYKYLGCEQRIFQACPGAPIQPGASCQFCGHDIREVHMLLSSDGKRFHVGCDCIYKAGDRGLKSEVDRVKSRQRAEKRNAKAVAVYQQLRAWLDDPRVQETLSAQPHPLDWAREQGKTRLDWATWMVTNAGAAGRNDVRKTILNLIPDLSI